jgi:RecB family exonuclease
VAVAAPPSDSPLTVPRPTPGRRPIEQMSPTAFRAYLACPYRFYLQYVVGLAEVSNEALELDGAAFGSLLHEVLRCFADEGARDSSDPVEIAAALDALLDQCAQPRFGQHPIAAVRVQLEQMRFRLRSFANQQADWYGQGWRIAHAEVTPNAGKVTLEVDGRPFRLTGRIDRIDVHRQTGQHAVLDYKSSDAGDAPEQVHRYGGHWVDLQLPLYRHLARGLGLDGPLRLGYVVLPKDATRTGFALAEWTEQQLGEADEVARQVVRKVREEVYWPPAELRPGRIDPFARICQVGVFDRPSVTEPQP